MMLAPSRDVRCGHDGATFVPAPQSPKSLSKTQSVIGCSRRLLHSIEGAECVYEIVRGVAYDVVISG